MLCNRHADCPCENSDCPDHYGDPEAWCRGCRQPDEEPAIIADMRRANALVEEAVGTSEYQLRMYALAMLARQFLRETAHLGEGERKGKEWQ